ncbi:FK506-binding protein 16-2 isoform 3 [Theobroma cacao]|uniref:peptidylprolyl isomerase n=1 Tax=Theobroma cacao TaxID=3641 RepID=A0A061DIA3_THECC|nr:FK506-binding protein 16-2 isoform 3 [Theobroma cacao]
MATSALTIATAKPLIHHSSNFKSLLSPSFSCSCSSSLPPPNEVKLSFKSKPAAPKNCVFNVGVGLLAASVLAFSPLDADATRVEYYATVGEPQCELKYASSGLGYCDVIVGSGEEAPRGELVNVIKGLDQGIAGGEGVPPMFVGGKRKLWIPPNLAYGPEPAGCFSGDCNIPANATLLYDINFVGIYSGNAK